MSEILRNLKLNLIFVFLALRKELQIQEMVLKNLDLNEELKLNTKSDLYDFEGTNTKNFIKKINDDFNSLIFFS